MKYFTKQELIRCYCEKKEQRCKECRLTQAVRRAPYNVDVNIEALVDNVLDPAREAFGHPIIVNSGFRCPLHNTTVGGARHSQHMEGEAADIAALSREYSNMREWKQANLEIAKLIMKGGKFDQLILENTDANDLLPTWIHVSYKAHGLNRGQVLKKVSGQKGYPALSMAEMDKLNPLNS